MTHTIGFLGAGPVTQAIHLPSLALLGDAWRVGAVMDINLSLARSVADRCGARALTDADAVIADPAIDVIAICSPNALHADQAIAACRAGKRAILCEKPLAVTVEQALAVKEAAAQSGTAIIVGAMHRHDPAFRAALADWQAAGDRPLAVKSSFFLPANGSLVRLATEEAIPGGPPPAGGPLSPDQQRAMLRQVILGLGIHHIPLLRLFHGRVGRVLAARYLPPFGFSMLMEDEGRTAELLAVMPGQWAHHWTFEVTGEHSHMLVDFPPSYVQAGSARAHLARGAQTSTHAFPDGGYVAQWRQLHLHLAEGAPLAASIDDVVADLTYALDLAEKAMAVMEIAQ